MVRRLLFTDSFLVEGIGYILCNEGTLMSVTAVLTRVAQLFASPEPLRVSSFVGSIGLRLCFAGVLYTLRPLWCSLRLWITLPLWYSPTTWFTLLAWYSLGSLVHSPYIVLPLRLVHPSDLVLSVDMVHPLSMILSSDLAHPISLVLAS